MKSDLPLYVDLDGTLIKTDTLYESCSGLIKKNIFTVFCIFLWLLKGRGYLKSKVASRVNLNIASLPYDKSFLQFIKGEFNHGRVLILATASAEKYARQVADHVGIFSGVLCSSEKNNLRGVHKKNAILEHNKNRAFSYAGNSWDDARVWEHADEIIMVNAPKNLQSAMTAKYKGGKKIEIFGWQNTVIPVILRMCRMQHWIKDLVVFCPLIFTHAVTGLHVMWTLSWLSLSLICFTSALALFEEFLHSEKCGKEFSDAGSVYFSDGINPYVIIKTMGVLIFLSFAIGFYLSWSYVVLLVIISGAAIINVSIFKKNKLSNILITIFMSISKIYAGVLVSGTAISKNSTIFFVLLCINLSMLEFYWNEKKHGPVPAAYRYMGIVLGYLPVIFLIQAMVSEAGVNCLFHGQHLWFPNLAFLVWSRSMWRDSRKVGIGTDGMMMIASDKSTWLFALFMGAWIAWIWAV